MSERPLIRHCNNCEFLHWSSLVDGAWCMVRYKYVSFPRLKALTCKYYSECAPTRLPKTED